MDDLRTHRSAFVWARPRSIGRSQRPLALERCYLALIGLIGQKPLHHHVWFSHGESVPGDLYRCGAGHIRDRDPAHHDPLPFPSALYHPRHHAHRTKRLIMKHPPVMRVAHRGASAQYPENTMLAFRQAIQQGVDMLELDVHLTSDNELIVMHDTTLDRTTNGHGNIHDHSLQEIRQLNAGQDEKVPLR